VASTPAATAKKDLGRDYRPGSSGAHAIEPGGSGGTTKHSPDAGGSGRSNTGGQFTGNGGQAKGGQAKGGGGHSHDGHSQAGQSQAGQGKGAGGQSDSGGNQDKGAGGQSTSGGNQGTAPDSQRKGGGNQGSKGGGDQGKGGGNQGKGRGQGSGGDPAGTGPGAGRSSATPTPTPTPKPTPTPTPPATAFPAAVAAPTPPAAVTPAPAASSPPAVVPAAMPGLEAATPTLAHPVSPGALLGQASSGRAVAVGADAAGAAAGATTAAGAVAGPAARPGPAEPTNARARASRASREGSAVVRTVDRIVSVIPWSMWLLIGVLGAATLALGARSWIGERQRRRLRDDVGLLQSALLPVIPAAMGPLATSAAYRPAEGPGAGGDFYDMFTLAGGRLAVIVGDLSGHGRDVLSQTALARYTLRAYLEAGLAPRAALQTAAGVLDHQLGVAFATVALATYDPTERTLTYACAGHPPPIVLGSEPVRPVAMPASPPVGAGLSTGIRQTVVSVPGQATICFYTDGLLEARIGGELFGAERLERALAQLGPGATAAGLLNHVAETCDRRPDDMAACVVGVRGADLAPAVREEELELDRHELSTDRPERFLLACGVEQERIPGLRASAADAVERLGAAVLHVSLGAGSPTVEVRLRDVEILHAPDPNSATFQP
jgi:stage II sporulation SpoE-like protein